MSKRHPIGSGVALAGLSALLFGVTAPLVQRASEGAGSLASASLLYVGAAIAASMVLVSTRSHEAPLRRAQLGALLTVSLFGGLVAPLLLVLGLKRTDSARASLLLALEAPLTLAIARVFFAERIGRRVLAAAGLIAIGAVVAVGGHAGGTDSMLGGAAVVAATLAWALDNTVSRQLADRDPLAVVAGKGFLGGLSGAAASFAIGQVWPDWVGVASLLAIGALGFGVSLQLYLRAQRIIGAGRTASVFAMAPFAGAAAGLAMGAPWPGPAFAVAAALVAAGAWLHATETHGHTHTHYHPELEHEHAHTHEDGQSTPRVRVHLRVDVFRACVWLACSSRSLRFSFVKRGACFKRSLVWFGLCRLRERQGLGMDESGMVGRSSYSSVLRLPRNLKKARAGARSLASFGSASLMRESAE